MKVDSSVLRIGFTVGYGVSGRVAGGVWLLCDGAVSVASKATAGFE